MQISEKQRQQIFKSQKIAQDKEAKKIRKHAAMIAAIADELWERGDGEGGLVYSIIREEFEKAGRKVNPYAFVNACKMGRAVQS